MPDDKNLDVVLEKFYNRYNQFNTKILKKMGKTIKLFDGISPSEAHILAQQLKYGTDIDDLINELSTISGKSAIEVQQLLDKVAEENVNFAEAYYKAQNKEFIKYKDNKQLQRYVNAIKNETGEMFYNISKASNIGFVFKDSRGRTIFKPIKDVYNDLIDEAVINVSTGQKDYYSAMRNVINQLADSGVKVHEDSILYKSGYNRRIDSSVRQHILDSVRQTNIKIQEEVGREFGSDGVEVSAHSPCAEDHLPINGRQFSKKEFERINSNLDRPVGWYNCRHFVFSIILGVNKPEYSKKELHQMEIDSKEKIEYEGKTYTKYQATQTQRKLETEIRRQKDRQIIARSSGDKEEIAKAQEKITILTRKYKDFSNNAGLPVYIGRMRVSGYKRVSTK